MTTISNGIELLPYECSREIARRYIARGHTVSVRRKRTGSLAIKIDGSRELGTNDALLRMEREVFDRGNRR